MKVRWTEKATTDLLSIWEYVARQSPVYADIVSEKVLESPNRLIEHPRSFRNMSETIFGKFAFIPFE